MMKRYYLSKIFRDMSDPGFPAGVWRHRLQTYSNVAYAGGEIAVDSVTGIPTQKVLLVLVDAPDHLVFAADTGLADFPEVALDTKVSAVGTDSKNKSKKKMEDLGLTKAEVDNIWVQADSVREIVDRMGKLNNQAFDSRAFDVI